MAKQTIKRLVWVVSILALSSALADVKIRFEQPDKFTDLNLGGSSTPTIQNDLMSQFEKYFYVLSEQFLSKGDRLEIVVEDIDMAGAFEPWRTPNLTNTRIIRDVYPPRFKLHYTWYDRSGRLKTDRNETISDLNYLTLLDSRQYNDNDPLRYEKALLYRWFNQTFASTGKEIP